MEKYYEVTPAANLHNAFVAHENYINTLIGVFGKFAEEHGIETSKFSPSVERLQIVPTAADAEKFDSQLIHNKKFCELGTFKILSPMAKAWREACEAAGYSQSVIDPRLLLPGTFNVCKIRYRLFREKDGVIYCSVDSEQQFDTPEGFKELKASEFYRRMEELGCVDEL